MRNYTLMVFSSGDFNKIKELMMKYSLIEGKQNVKKFKMNREETITQLLGYFDVETCQSQGIDPEMFSGIQKQKKMRSKIIVDSQKKFCGGIEREQIFKECVLPVLLTICENQSVNMIDLITQIIQQIYLLKNKDDPEDEEMEGDEQPEPIVQDENLLKSFENLKGITFQKDQSFRQLPVPFIPPLIQMAPQKQMSNEQMEQMILEEIQQNKDKLTDAEVQELLSNLVKMKQN